MSPPLIFLAIDVAAVICAALLIVRVLASRPRLPAAQLVALIAFGVLCGVVLAHEEYGPWMPPAFRIDVSAWSGFLNLARNTTPGGIMLLCFTLFTDRRRFPRWLLVLFALQLILEEPARWVVPPAWPYARLVTQTAPALLQTLFAGFALYWTVADWRGDLIESRRRTRAITSVVVGVLSILSGLLTRVLIDPASPVNYGVHVALIAADVAILLVVLVQLSEGDVARQLDFAPAPRDEPAARPAAADLARLTALLEEQAVWREEGLSLQGLAVRVGLPEYRLRRLIHEQLGYRNFNALLHDYRIREACRRLSDPGLRRTPILTIALSIGYASVNTFNRGFREIVGETPSAWREAALAAARAATPQPAANDE